MKIMKKINLILGAILAVFAFTACTDEIEYDAAAPEKAQGVYFAETNSTIQLVSGQVAFDVEVGRVNSADAQEVAVSVISSTDSVGVLSIPSQVKFNAGDSVAYMTITCDMSKKSPVTTLNVVLSIDGASSYEKSEMALTVKLPEWISLGNAVYVEDLVTTFFGVDNLAYYVEIQQHIDNPGRYRLVNPYGAAYPYNVPDDYDASKDYYMEIDATDPDGVVMPMFYSGMNWGYGEFAFISMASYYIDMQGNPFEAVKAAGYCGTFKDGVITFPAGAILIGMSEYNNFGLYQSNGSGKFAVYMPGVYESMASAKALSTKKSPIVNSKGALVEGATLFAK